MRLDKNFPLNDDLFQMSTPEESQPILVLISPTTYYSDCSKKVKEYNKNHFFHINKAVWFFETVAVMLVREITYRPIQRGNSPVTPSRPT
jgi:hypothetical protein